MMFIMIFAAVEIFKKSLNQWSTLSAWRVVWQQKEFIIAGQQDLYEYCNRPRRHILEVLYDFR